MNEVSITTEDAVKRRILLSDGRYMIFFSFETPQGHAATEVSAPKRDSGSAPTTRSGGSPVV